LNIRLDYVKIVLSSIGLVLAILASVSGTVLYLSSRGERIAMLELKVESTDAELISIGKRIDCISADITLIKIDMAKLNAMLQNITNSPRFRDICVVTQEERPRQLQTGKERHFIRGLKCAVSVPISYEKY